VLWWIVPWGGATDADLVALLIDVRKWDDPDTIAIVEKMATVRQRKALILNKVDTIDKPKLIEIAEALNAKAPFDATFMVAAITGYGVKDMAAWMAKQMSPGPWLYPEDQISDAPLRFLAAEITREKMFERLHDELPYRSTVETDTWESLKDGSVKINQTIFVERESQRKIVLGEKGATIKSIGSSARKDIMEAAETKVHLFLFVKVRENWGEDPERYRVMGLEYPRN
jgi:GTPase